MLEEQESSLPEPPPKRTLTQLAELQQNAHLPAGIPAHRDWFDAKAVEAMPTATRKAYMTALRGIFPLNEDAQPNPNDLLVSFSARDLNQPTSWRSGTAPLQFERSAQR